MAEYINFNDSINKTVEWYSNYLNPKIKNISAKQLDEYIKLAKKRKGNGLNNYG